MEIITSCNITGKSAHQSMFFGPSCSIMFNGSWIHSMIHIKGYCCQSSQRPNEPLKLCIFLLKYDLVCLCTSHLFYCDCAHHIYSTGFVHITFILLCLCTSHLFYCIWAHYLYSFVFVHITFIHFI